MFGVVPGSLQPYTPTESQLMSSVVMMSRFIRSAARANGLRRRQARKRTRSCMRLRTEDVNRKAGRDEKSKDRSLPIFAVFRSQLHAALPPRITARRAV